MTLNDTHYEFDARLSPHGLTIEHDQQLLRTDASGRWAAMRLGTTRYQRALDGSVVQRAPHRLIELDASASLRAHRRAGDLAKELLMRLAAGEKPRPHGSVEPDALRGALEQASRWSPEALLAEADRFQHAYPDAVPILPPHRCRDVVVLPATGCPSAQCRFCAFYQGQRFRKLDAADFRQHLLDVQQFFGPTIDARDGVFLGSASALSLGQAHLLLVLETTAEALGVRKRGVASFLDPDHAPERTTAEYAALRHAGLLDVTIGLETGLENLRQTLGKQPSLEQLQIAVAGLKAASMRVALTILVGAGGPEAKAPHRAATARALAQLPLDRDDLVYLSALDGALSAPALQQEMRALHDACAAVCSARVTPYRFELFRYFA